MDENDNDSLLRLFTTLWSCTLLISLSGLPEWFDYMVWSDSPIVYFHLALTAVGLFTLVKPDLKSLLLLLSAQICLVAFSMPDVPNHRMLMTFVSSAFLASYLLNSAKSGKWKIHSRDFFPAAIQMSRIAFLVVYFFAALAKLNTSYFDPTLSCSVKFYANIVSWFPFLPEGELFNTLSIYAPTILEILIPFGLLSKRFRKKSIIIGLLFHFVLALDLTQRFLNFSMVTSVLYLLFLDASYLKTLEKKWRERVPSHAILFGFVLTFIFGVLHALFSWTTALLIVQHLVWTTIFCGMFLAVLFSPPIPLENQTKGRLPCLQIVFFLILVLNGISPYLGTKTRTSFNMYSNLRIEPNYSNHLFMGPSLDIFGNLSDVVQIQTIEPDGLENENFKEGHTLTHFEFSRHFTSQNESELKVHYTRNGQPGVATFENPPEGPTWIERKLLIYRPLGEAVVQECIW